MNRGRLGSLDTILTYTNNEWQNDWSAVWSTSHIPGMDNASGGRPRRTGRRRLRLGSLAVASCLAMHLQICATALTTGTLVLSLAVAALANPLRHFEVYLGQWSLSGPGRAFRIVPMLDGIGIAICLNSIMRAICCVCIASATGLYVYHSISDRRLPFTYCRNLNLQPFEPVVMNKVEMIEWMETRDVTAARTRSVRNWSAMNDSKYSLKQYEFCNGSFSGYSGLYHVPAYNFFYLEILQMRPGARHVNAQLLAMLVLVWLSIWCMMLAERFLHGKLIWNNIGLYVLAVPWLWISVLVVTVCFHVAGGRVNVSEKIFRVTDKGVISIIADAMVVAIYVHSAGTGTELIHGKGLNRFASGHIDPILNGENVMHSILVLTFCVVQSAAGTACALLDDQVMERLQNTGQSVLWMIPLYSKCSQVGQFSHFMSVLMFGGLTFAYVAVAYTMIKSALHTIFEYRVKLVFVEQLVVAGLLCACMLLSSLFVTSWGGPLAETAGAALSGAATPAVCLLELAGLLLAYRGRDFLSDLRLAAEEHACPSRLPLQWQSLPLLLAASLVARLAALHWAGPHGAAALLPLAAVAAAVPLRCCHNAYAFLRPAPRRET